MSKTIPQLTPATSANDTDLLIVAQDQGAARSIRRDQLLDRKDASETVKGAVKLSVPPVSTANPLAVGDNDPRLAALASRFTLRDIYQLASNAIDTRLATVSAGASGQNLYSTRSDSGSGNYARSPDWFGSDLDLTCLAVYNTSGVTSVGTLISPRHIIGANHAFPAIGATFRLVTSTNTIVTRTLSASAQVGSTDIRIGLLDSDLPATISFARVLPDLITEIRLRNAPLFYIDQNQEAFVVDRASGSSGLLTVGSPPESNRVGFYHLAISGDSGHPIFVILDDMPVLLTTYNTANYGPSIAVNRSAIDTVMGSLGGSYTLTPIEINTQPTQIYDDSPTTLPRVAMDLAVRRGYGPSGGWIFDWATNDLFKVYNELDITGQNLSKMVFIPGSSGVILVLNDEGDPVFQIDPNVGSLVLGAVGINTATISLANEVGFTAIIDPQSVGANTTFRLPNKAAGTYTLFATAPATISQAANVNTGVTINSSIGVITTQSASTAANAVETGFQVTNSQVTTASVVLARVVAYAGTYGTNGLPEVVVDAVSNGSFHVKIVNNHGTNALSGTMKIHFAVL